MENCATYVETYLLEFFLDFGYAIWRVVWVCYVIFVYSQIATRSLQHQVDNLS
jgi:hypothetical protein